MAGLDPYDALSSQKADSRPRLLAPACVYSAGPRTAVLDLWVMTPLGVELPFHRGGISDILPIRYLHYDS